MKRSSAVAKLVPRAAIGAAILAAAAMAQSSHAALHSVTAVRHWNVAGVTRIAIEVTGEFEYRSDRLHDPERVYYDILDSRPNFDRKRLYAEDVNDRFVKRIRVAETQPGITRIVLDLNGAVQANASVLTSPDRLIVELRPGDPALLTNSLPQPSAAAPAAKPLPPAPAPSEPAPPAVSTVKLASPAPSAPAVYTAPPVTRIPDEAAPKMEPKAKPQPPKAPPKTETKTESKSEPPTLPPVTVAARTEAAKVEPPIPAPPLAPTPTLTPAPAPSASSAPAAAAAVATNPSPGVPPEGVPKAARRTSTGGTSLVRTLGLKLQRIVIDPGHGGHDEGTQGPRGLLEKDLVLDVSLRLGRLIEDKMGAEVIYTRTDDTFIPLEARTALANEKKADLFLSIHANSSPAPRITGVETYYLNFTDSKDAMEVAARENAGSGESIFELRDLIEKISLHDKASESRDFAERIQSALFAFSSKTFPSERNRGVKQAPFVVLIGANMPSVLAEIGFVSNPREESLLKKPEYRQKLAEALYRGVSKYAESLSHFQVAAN